jgi:hypothetical protein
MTFSLADRLPGELLLYIIERLPQKDQAALSCVSRDIHRIVESCRYKVVNLDSQSPAKLYCLVQRIEARPDICKQLQELTIEGKYCCSYSIDRGLRRKTVADRKAAWNTCKSLLRFGTTRSDRRLASAWRRASIRHFTSSLLACIIYAAQNLVSLHYHPLCCSAVLSFLSPKLEVDGSRYWPKLKTLDLRLTLDRAAPSFPLLSSLVELKLQGSIGNFAFRYGAIAAKQMTNITTLAVLDCNPATSMVISALQDNLLPYLESLHLRDREWNPAFDYTRLPRLLRSKCAHLHDLHWDASYLDNDDSYGNNLSFQDVNDFKHLGTIRTLRVHRDFLFKRSERTQLATLYSRIPPNIEQLVIMKLVPEEVCDLLGHPEGGSRISITKPTALRELSLGMDHVIGHGDMLADDDDDELGIMPKEEEIRAAAADLGLRVNVLPREVDPWDPYGFPHHDVQSDHSEDHLDDGSRNGDSSDDGSSDDGSSDDDLSSPDEM